jgi:hypothetical protein
VLKARLSGAVYHADNTSSWAREIADDIKKSLKGVKANLAPHLSHVKWLTTQSSFYVL